VAADAADEKTTTLPVASLSPFISQKSQNVGLPEQSSLVVLISQKTHKKTRKNNKNTGRAGKGPTIYQPFLKS
jgi:hypothetical protein